MKPAEKPPKRSNTGDCFQLVLQPRCQHSNIASKSNKLHFVRAGKREDACLCNNSGQCYDVVMSCCCWVQVRAPASDKWSGPGTLTHTLSSFPYLKVAASPRAAADERTPLSSRSQCGRDLQTENYITPEQWRSVREKCWPQVNIRWQLFTVKLSFT